ncbi:hypothetical protein KAR48_15755 [bacterium]|nr:hypothetical protein [bacterium]
MKSYCRLVITAIMLSLAATVMAEKIKVQVIEKTYTISSQKIIVDNVYGSIKVTGHNKNTVELKVTRHTTARNAEQLDKAEKDVILDITEDTEFLEFYIDGPFRWNEGRTRRNNRYRERDYKVMFNFELLVPKNINIELKTVNDGDIRVNNVHGDFEVEQINGSITMQDLGGSGEAYSINGDVTLDFSSNPKNDCRFGALNGEVRMNFKKNLNADFLLDTFNGEFFTDFEFRSNPSKTFMEVKRNGRKVYKAGHVTSVRAGKGGPVIKLDGFNGDMYILNKDR